MKKFLSTLTKSLLICLLIAGITACGFSLRGTQALPESLTRVAINAPLQYSPLSRALQKRLPVYQLEGSVNSTTIIDVDMLEKTVVVQLEPEKFERRLLSVFSTGQVAEYELVFTVNYTIIFPHKIPIKNSLQVSREYQDDPEQILAKSRELNLVLGELRIDAADRIIRLMSSQYNSSVINTDIQAKKTKRSALRKGN